MVSEQEDCYGNFPYGPMLNVSSAVAAIIGRRSDMSGHKFGRGPPNDHFSKVWLRLAQ